MLRDVNSVDLFRQYAIASEARNCDVQLSAILTRQSLWKWTFGSGKITKLVNCLLFYLKNHLKGP